MIIKSYEANKATLKEYTIILLYGKNEGLQNEIIERNYIVDFKGTVNKYDENEFINSYETISSEILTKPLFDEKKKLISLVKELKLEKEVIFLDNIDQKLKISLIQNSNLFLMPSIKYKRSVEGFGISFIEAASYGVGSIGGKDGGAEDAIRNNETGLICDGQDISSIYNSILEFLKNDNYKRFGSNAIKFSENFSWKKIIRQYLDLI